MFLNIPDHIKPKNLKFEAGQNKCCSCATKWFLTAANACVPICEANPFLAFDFSESESKHKGFHPAHVIYYLIQQNLEPNYWNNWHCLFIAPSVSEYNRFVLSATSKIYMVYDGSYFNRNAQMYGISKSIFMA